MKSNGDYSQRLESSYLFGGNAPFVEGLYENYLSDPASVGAPWRTYFDSLETDPTSPHTEVAHSEIQQSLIEAVRARRSAPTTSGHPHDTETARKQAAVLRLIGAYRLLGHHRAHVDPISLRALPFIPDLNPHFHGLTEGDYDTIFTTSTLVGPEQTTLRDILATLKETYTGRVATEFMHITDIEEKQWLYRRLEGSLARPKFSPEEKKHILERLTAAEGIETYLHRKYAGQKRFSLEGGESLIPMLDELIQRSGSQGVKEIAIAMAHRGRLNVLVNIMGKQPGDLFSEFEHAKEKKSHRSGDVKYHQGFSSDVETPSGPLHLALAFNPSHLEIVDPVCEGSTRARQDRRGDRDRKEVFAILIHGDAAIAGQGVVYETFNLSQTRGYSTGGTVHIVVNNRIGFTTSHPLDTRSMLHCTDVGKVVQAPIFHVNADDPEAVIFVTQLAWDFRATFKKDVVIDLICYRRHGHNEADEPAATQPMMYRKVKEHPTTREIYAAALDKEGVVSKANAEQIAEAYRDALDANLPVSEHVIDKNDYHYPYIANWAPFMDGVWTSPADTRVQLAELKDLGTLMCKIPEDFELHPRVSKVMDDRLKAVMGGLPMDWGTAESLAYASLIKEGYAIRLTGQDSGRGTFFHRHAVLHNQRNGESYVPLQHLFDDQPRFTVIDSILSEEAVLGFEYGYSATDPNTLVLWEAQYGDFANGAQVVIDQFISSSEQKWGLLSGVVLMLPHGWEGQGPEHSSARLERYLQLCAQENLQVCTPTTPAQMFHMIRRQMIRKYRKPLIIMSPKSMLRRKISFCELEDLAHGEFRNVIGEVDELDRHKVERVVVCAGKVFYDLLEARRENNVDNVAVVRVEQLYPFPAIELTGELRKYPNAKEIVWTQEEPRNQGAWYSIQHVLRSCMVSSQSLIYSGRTPSAAPAGGDYLGHLDRQNRLVRVALKLEADRTAPLPLYELHPPIKHAYGTGSE